MGKHYQKNTVLCRYDGSKSMPNPEVDAFLRDIIKVCEEHGFSIEHEDGQGAFIITKFNEAAADWLFLASTAIGRT